MPTNNAANSRADANTAGKHILLEQQTLNTEQSLIYQAGTREPTVSKVKIIQFNSIQFISIYYLRAESTATKL
jgi:hypothetical protein